MYIFTRNKPLKFHNNDVSITWTKDLEHKKQSPPPHPELFFKKGVMQIRRKMYTSYVSLWLFSKYTKIPEDLENFIVEENKHES